MTLPESEVERAESQSDGPVTGRLASLSQFLSERSEGVASGHALRDILRVLTGDVPLAEVEMPDDLRVRVSRRLGSPCVLVLDGREFEVQVIRDDPGTPDPALDRVEARFLRRFGGVLAALVAVQEVAVYLRPLAGGLGPQVTLSSLCSVAEHLEMMLNMTVPLEGTVSEWPDDVPSQPDPDDLPGG